jgi:hypothetical protein
VIEVLKVLFRERGTPEYLRSDNVLTPESTFLGRAMVPFAAAWFAQPFHELR